MKKIIGSLVFSVLAISALSAQAQIPGFSNTVHASFGQSYTKKKPKVEFFGFTDYFTGNVTVGKLVFAGDIAWQLIPTSRGINTRFIDPNLNVVITPIKNLDIGLGTNLDWTVGPGPSSGPAWSAYNMPYYGGLNLKNAPEKVSSDRDYPTGGFKVINYYAQKAFAVRYKYKNILEAGVSLPSLKDTDNFNAGLGIKANVKDKFTIGFAYNGPFNAGENYLYLGTHISAVKNFIIDAYWNMLTDSGTTQHDGANTVGGAIAFTVRKFYIKPEFAVTLWSDTDWAPAFYAAVNSHIYFSKEIRGGLKASWGLGSDLVKNDPDNKITAGARLDLNPHIVWFIDKKNVFSAGVHIIPMWWRDGTNTFAWEIPVAWKFLF